MKPADGRKRVVIEDVAPQVDGGRYPVQRVIGEQVKVTAAIFADGHDLVAARALYRHQRERGWQCVPMQPCGNDLWSGSFNVSELGLWSFTVLGWIDHFESWAADLRKRLAAFSGVTLGAAHSNAPASAGAAPRETNGSGISLALRTGAILLQQGAARAPGADGKKLASAARELEASAELSTITKYPLSEEIHELMAAHPDLSRATRFDVELPIRVDRERARFSAWYEMFPRSASPVPGQHGTFADVERQLPEIAAMGFDVLYLPPIHPIGRAYRKGVNDSVVAGPEAVGSPWAIGDAEACDVRPGGDKCTKNCGGHKSIHSQLGSFDDFDHLVRAARSHEIEVALDIAFQCSPDHPWVKEHPDWFVIRPDGSIQYAENPPKKYHDIYPLNFESEDWRNLWDELYSVFEFWSERGVHIFRVDNPHTKAFPFWEWCLAKLRCKYPETICLAEAFTRPHVMYGLAKRGFSQSYTYFTWRNTKTEIEEYLQEVTVPPVSDFFRPNFWPNTPDILHKSFQEGGAPVFGLRVILAATLAANYGIYGPAYELAESLPARPAPGKSESEEYLNSEKYAIRQRDRNAPGSLVPLIARLNHIRRANLALQSNESLRFHEVENPKLLCYTKTTSNLENRILTIVNLDPIDQQAGWTNLSLGPLGLAADESYVVHDLLNDEKYTWSGGRNYVALQPGTRPAHVFRVSSTVSV